MPVDTSIYGMIQAPKMAGPLDQYAQAMTVGNLVNQGKLQDLQLRTAQRGEEEGMRIRALFARGDVKPEEIDAISPEKGLAYRKSQVEAQTAAANLRKTEMETLSKATSILKDRLPTVRDQASYAAYVDQAKRLLGPDKVAQLNLPASFDPAWVRNQLVKSEELFTPKVQNVTMPDGSIKALDMNPFTNPAAVNFNAAPGMTPAQRDQQRHNLVMEGQGAARLAFDTGMSVPGAAVPSPSQTQPGGGAVVPTSPASPALAGTPGISPKAAQEMAVDKAKKNEEVSKTLNTYVAARDGMLTGLGGSVTGPILGRMPSITAKQQIAEGGVAAMAPVLKQLFRVAGEGVFTDKDQALLMEMIPTRADEPEARKAKIENIDRIVSAKLGMDVPAFKAEAMEGKPSPQIGKPSRADIDAELRRRKIIP